MDVDFDPVESDFWARRGSMMTALLAIIPGTAIVFSAVAHAWGESVPAFICGFGVGMVIWGAIVALSK